MTSRLIGSGLSDHLSSSVRAKVECCKSSDLFSCQVKDCSATRILYSSIMGRHPQPTGSLIFFFGGGPFAGMQSAYSIAQANRAESRPGNNGNEGVNLELEPQHWMQFNVILRGGILLLRI